MTDDWVWRLLRRFGRPVIRPGDHERPPEHVFDERLDDTERRLRGIEARLELLERQADPRRLRRDG